MGRAVRAERESGGSAARVAARRRPVGRSRDEGRGAARAAPPRGGRAARGGGPSGAARAFKLGLLVLAFCAIGFFAVLVIDVGISMVGQVRLGETTVVEVWQKVVDRFLDRDVPRTEPPKAPGKERRRVAGASTSSSSSSSSSGSAGAERAPLPAARPEDDARHVDGAPPRSDPEREQIEQARRRLDALLGRL